MWPENGAEAAPIRLPVQPMASELERSLDGMSGRLHSSEGCKRVLGLGSRTVPHETASFTELYLAFYVILNGTLRNSRTRANKTDLAYEIHAEAFSGVESDKETAARLE